MSLTSDRLRIALPAALLALALTPPSASAVTFYDIGFEEPVHAVGAPPALADGLSPSRTPDSINFGTPTVVAARGEMASNSLELFIPSDAPTSLEQIQFATPSREEFYAIEFDVVIESALSGSSFTDGFNVLFDASGGVNAMRFRTDGTIRGFSADSSAPIMARYTIGEVMTVRSEVVTSTNSWSLFIDGDLVHESGEFIHWMNSMRMSLSDSSLTGSGSVLVDNIRIVVSPEPSTGLLVAGGLAFIAARRRTSSRLRCPRRD